MNEFFSDRLSNLLRNLIPAACVLCGQAAGNAGVCAECLKSLPALPRMRCPVCAAGTEIAELCGRCLSRPPKYDRVKAALEYAHPVDALIVALKYRRSLEAARPLAYCLAQAMEQEDYPDLVIPMPIAPQRLAERGFNQAAEIARLACAEFGIVCTSDIVRRVRGSVAQASLPWGERHKNVRGAFESSATLSGMAIAVVDDVLTTGSTLDELAGVLKKRGARSVTGWVVARTLAQR